MTTENPVPKNLKLLMAIGMAVMLIAGCFAGSLIAMLMQGKTKCPTVVITPTTIPSGTIGPTVCNNTETPVTLTGVTYYHRIVAYAHDKNGRPVLVKIQLTRNQNSRGEYDHSYLVYLTQGTTDYVDWRSFTDKSHDIVAGGLLSSYEYFKFPDASPRETYKFAFDLKGQKLSLEITDINGDFISKTGLANTRFVSAGTAKIVVNGETISGNVMVDQIYSANDGSPDTLTPAENVKYRTNSLILWDELGNFYLIDTTDVDTPGSNYPTHRWILVKDKATKAAYKAFDANLTFKDGKYQIIVPEMANLTFDLNVIHDFAPNKGIVKGTVVKNGKSLAIGGNYVFVSGP